MPIQINRVGSLLTVFFGLEAVTNFDEAQRLDRDAFSGFFHGMLDRGVYLPPSPFEAWFLSLAHTEEEITQTLKALQGAICAIPR